ITGQTDYVKHTSEVRWQKTFVISHPTKAFYSPPQLRRGGATGSGLARRDGAGETIRSLDQHHPSRGLNSGFALSGSRFAASAFPSSAEEGSLPILPSRIWGAFAPIY